MTKTVEQLQLGIEALSAKNKELLAEKKKMQAQRDELATLLEQAQAKAEEANAKLYNLTVRNPRMETLEALAVPGMAEVLWRELNHNFDIDDQTNAILTKDGEPVLVDDEPVTLTEQGLNALYKHDLMGGIGKMLRGTGSTGGGAMGSHTRTPHNSPKPAHSARFGMK